MQGKVPKVYLSGPMEFAPDGGAGWRKVASDYLTLKGFEVFNPVDSSIQLLQKHGIASVQEYNDLKKLAQVDKIACSKYIQATRLFIDYDLENLKNSDLVLVVLNKTVSGGTSGELTVARDLCIPIVALAAREDMLNMSAWTFSCANEIAWFESDQFQDELVNILEDLVEYLNIISEDNRDGVEE